MAKPAMKSTKKVDKAPKKGLDLLRISLFGHDLPLYWTWIALGALVFVSHLMVKLEIKQATFEFLDAFAWVGPSEFRNADYSFGGTLEATEITLTPTDFEPGDPPITIGRIVVETPGPIWLLRTSMPSFSPKAPGTLGKLQKAAEKFGSEEPPNQYPPTDELHIRFENVDWSNFGLAYVLPGIDWVGGTSGSLFEAAGCSNDWWWTREEVRQRFNAPDADGEIDIDVNVTGPNTLTNRVAFGHGSNSALIIEREFTVPGEADDFLDSDPDEWRTTKVRWTVEDNGFVRARNRWCANEAKITEAQFVERHVAAVRRHLLEIGFEATPALLDAYRVFAQSGGKLVWETNIPPGKAIEDAAGHGAEAELIAMNARLIVPGRAPVPYIGTITEPRDEFPDDAASMVQVLQREGTLPAAGASATANVQASTAAAATPTTDATDAPTIAAASATAASEPVAAAPAAAPTAPTADVTDPTFAEVDALYAGAAGTEVAEPEPAEIIPGPFDTKDLPQHVGQTVRITLANGRHYAGIVESVDSQRVSIKVGSSGQSASLSFTRDMVTGVEAMGW